MENVVFNTMKKVLSDVDTKVYVCDCTTSAGKTYAMTLLVVDEYVKYLETGIKKYSKVLFIANLKSQFISTDVKNMVLKKYNNGEIKTTLSRIELIQKMEKDFVSIESVADDVNITELKNLQTFLRDNFNNSLSKTIVVDIDNYINNKNAYNYIKQQKISGISIEEIARKAYADTESSIRKNLKKFLQSKASKNNKDVLIQYAKKIWKQSNIGNKFFVEMHIAKCMVPIDTVIGPEYNFTKDKKDKSFLNNALLLMDEPDTLFSKMHQFNIDDMKKTPIKIKDFLITSKTTLDNFTPFRGNDEIKTLFANDFKQLKDFFDTVDKKISIVADYRVNFQNESQKNILLLGRQETRKDLFIKQRNENGKILIDILEENIDGNCIPFDEWRCDVTKLINATLNLIKKIAEHIYEKESKTKVISKSECYHKVMSEFGFDNTKNGIIKEAIERTMISNTFYHCNERDYELNIVYIEENNESTLELSDKPFEVSVFIKLYDETDQLITMLDIAEKSFLCSATGTINTFIGNFNIEKLRKHFGCSFKVFGENPQNVKALKKYMSDFRKESGANYYVCPLTDEYNMNNYICDKHFDEMQKVRFNLIVKKAFGEQEINFNATRFINNFLSMNIPAKNKDSKFYYNRYRKLFTNIGCAVYHQLCIAKSCGTNIMVFVPNNIYFSEQLKKDFIKSVRRTYIQYESEVATKGDLNVCVASIKASDMNATKGEDGNEAEKEYDKVMKNFATNIEKSVRQNDKYCNILFLSFQTGDTGINLKISNVNDETINKLLQSEHYVKINDLSKLEINFDTLISLEKTYKTGIETRKPLLEDKLKTLEMVNNAIDIGIAHPVHIQKFNEYINNGTIEHIPKMFEYKKEDEYGHHPTTALQLPVKNSISRGYIQMIARRQRGNIEPKNILFIISDDVDFHHIFSNHTGLNPELLCDDLKNIKEELEKNCYFVDISSTQMLDKNVEKAEFKKQNEQWAFFANNEFGKILSNYRKGIDDYRINLYQNLKSDTNSIIYHLTTNDEAESMKAIFNRTDLPSIYIKNNGQNNYYYKQHKNGTFEISYTYKSENGWKSFEDVIHINKIAIQQLDIGYYNNSDYEYIVGPWFINIIDGEIAEKLLMMQSETLTSGGSSNYIYTTNANCKDRGIFELSDFIAEHSVLGNNIAIDIKNTMADTSSEFISILSSRSSIRDIKQKSTKLKEKFNNENLQYIILNMRPHKVCEHTLSKVLVDENGNVLKNVTVINDCITEDGNITPLFYELINKITH